MRRLRSNSVLLTVNGVTKSITEWARDTGKTRGTIEWRLRLGWDAAEAIFTVPSLRDRSTNILITINGVTKNVAEWSRATGRPQGTIRARIRAGWDPIDAVTRGSLEYAQLSLKEKQRYARHGWMGKKRTQR